MTKKKIFFLVAFLILIPWINCLAQEESIGQEKLLEWLNLYLTMNENDALEGSTVGLLELREKGIDPLPFSLGLISDIRYSEYWNDALRFYCYTLHEQKKFAEMAIKFAEWLDRKEVVYTGGIIKFKIWCLEFLLQMVGPNYFLDEELKKTVLDYASRYFQQGKVTDPKFWFKRFSLEKLAILPRNSLAQEDQDSLMWAETLGRESVVFAGYLFYATQDSYYENIVRESMNSEFYQVKNKAIWTLSEVSRNYWLSGRYELFASEDQPYRTPEEIERMKQNSGGSMRSIKNKDQSQQQ